MSWAASKELSAFFFLFLGVSLSLINNHLVLQLSKYFTHWDFADQAELFSTMLLGGVFVYFGEGFVRPVVLTCLFPGSWI